MGISLKKYPPTAADLRYGDVSRALNSKEPLEECRMNIADYLGVKHLFPVDSGRSALYALLKATLPPGAKVVLPGYTCYTVAAAVVKAGMIPILSDSDPADLGYDTDDLKKTLARHPDIKAIVVCHLFGIALDIDEIRDIASRAVLVIDDAAQAFGLLAVDRRLGTGGDAGFFSFGRGKSLSISGGGLLVTDDDSLAGKIDQFIGDKFPPGRASSMDILRSKVYNLVVSPTGFSLASRLPGIKLGLSVYNPEFPVSNLPDFKVRLLSNIIKRADDLNRNRPLVARKYEELLSGADAFSIPRSKLDGHPGNLRFPILMRDTKARDSIIKRGRRLGISAMYPTALNAIDQLPGTADFNLPGAERIARSIITLPTHRHIQRAFQNVRFVEQMVELLT